MFRVFKNKKAQNTAEYAILIALVVGGVVAMQTYAQRALQGRLRDAAVAMRDQTMGMATGNGATTLQYEPYYVNSTTPTDTETIKEQTAMDVTDTSTSYTRNDGYVDRTEYQSNAVAGYNAAADTGLGF